MARQADLRSSSSSSSPSARAKRQQRSFRLDAGDLSQGFEGPEAGGLSQLPILQNPSQSLDVLTAHQMGEHDSLEVYVAARASESFQCLVSIAEQPGESHPIIQNPVGQSFRFSGSNLAQSRGGDAPKLHISGDGRSLQGGQARIPTIAAGQSKQSFPAEGAGDQLIWPESGGQHQLFSANSQAPTSPQEPAGSAR